ncbi:DUF2694 family protein [Mycolicibacterium brumae]|uniref:DUF2694 domain-containing protein n=1 Tax=Mycolicibacterium brumae TaxID=85968 RepID=A0A2G5PDG4_9MYCO|nr:DUF2694 family protein [Mycolicibacterium brumae]MCV7191755.1 DUF2694 family protein [Mycolicibacterium brumae]PIB76356.1 DUF2694 domain-containing protein [Mycolicibacterium brumae]UWW07061.1 DUF2694 domain-containing protein [Mycolicibacterium brumae]
MSEADPAFDATHPSGQLMFRSCRGGYLDSVVLTEPALGADAATLAEAIVRTADVSYLRAALAVREEIIAAGHSPSAELAGPADLRAAVARLAEHRLHPA